MLSHCAWGLLRTAQCPVQGVGPFLEHWWTTSSFLELSEQPVEELHSVLCKLKVAFRAGAVSRCAFASQSKSFLLLAWNTSLLSLLTSSREWLLGRSTSAPARIARMHFDRPPLMVSGTQLRLSAAATVKWHSYCKQQISHSEAIMLHSIVGKELQRQALAGNLSGRC